MSGGGSSTVRLQIGHPMASRGDSQHLGANGASAPDIQRRISNDQHLFVLEFAAKQLIAPALNALLGDPKALGLDGAFPALFLALTWPQIRDRRAAWAAVLGAAIALVTSTFAPPGVPIIAATLACLVALVP